MIWTVGISSGHRVLREPDAAPSWVLRTVNGMRFWILPVGRFNVDATVLDPGANPGHRFFIPVYAYLIETANGLLLFDTGCSTDCRLAPQELLGDEFSEVLTPDLTPDDMIQAQLSRLGFGVTDIDLVMNSHLHFDHAGGNQQFAHNRFMIQQKEWEAMDSDPTQYLDSAASAIDRTRLTLIDGDTLVDTGVNLLSTPGHTLGHQSLLIETSTGPLVITSDAVYTREQFNPDHLGASTDPELARSSVSRLIDVVQVTKARPFFSHDPYQARQENWHIAPFFYH